MTLKRISAACLLALTLAAVTPKPAEATAFYCAGCEIIEQAYNAFNKWWDSVNPFPLW